VALSNVVVGQKIADQDLSGSLRAVTNADAYHKVIGQAFVFRECGKSESFGGRKRGRSGSVRKQIRRLKAQSCDDTFKGAACVTV